MKRLIIFFLFLVLVLCSGYRRPFAVSKGVLINEIMWMGTEASVNDEWIELFNSTSNQIDLSDWILAAEDGTPQIKLQDSIAPGGFFLLERGDDQTVSNIVADQVYSGALGNNGEYLFLKNNLGQIIDEVDASLGWPVGSNEPIKASMARGVDGDWLTGAAGAGEAKDAAGNVINGTPREANNFFIFPTLTPIPSPSPTSIIPSPTATLTPTPFLSPTPTTEPQPVDYDNIFLNEVMANPKEGSEWVELYNGNDFAVNLIDWLIDDLANGGSSPQKFSLTIGPHDYKVINLKGAILNNTGDEVRLLNYNEELKDCFSYSKTTAGQSWGLADGEWCLQQSSPEKFNFKCLFSSLTPSPTPTATAKIVGQQNKDGSGLPEVLAQANYQTKLVDFSFETYLLADKNLSPFKKIKSTYQPRGKWLPNWLLFFWGFLSLGVSVLRMIKDRSRNFPL